MKKILSIMLSLLLVFTQFAMVGFAADAPTLAVSKVEGKAGETVEVMLSIADNGVAVKNYAIATPTFDTNALELVTGEALKIGSPAIAKWDASKGVLMGTYEDALTPCEGDILKLTFKVKDGATAGEYPITFGTVTVNNAVVELTAGSITVKADAPSTPTLAISKVEAEAGATVEVALSIADNGVAVKNYAIATPTFDTNALELVTGEALKIGSPAIAKWDASKGVLMGTYEDALTPCEGDILKLTFKVKEGAAAGEYPISFSTVTVNNAVVELTAGSITVKAPSVIEVTGISIENAIDTLEVGKEYTLKAIVEPADATDPSVTWTSSDDTIATVVDGKVVALKEGEVTITAKAGDKEVTCTITVERLLGDINGDGKLGLDDAVLLFNYSMAEDLFPVNYPYAKDLNGDGSVSLSDAVLLFNHSVNADQFPIAK